MGKNKLSAPVTIVNGVKYFKLVSPYQGDYTKNCGLLGNEIDENFFFLRSNDIEKIEFDKEKNLILTRVDGETISVNIPQDYGEYEFVFDKERGTIVITEPDGDVEELSGFLVEGKDIHVPTDDTISGLGTILDPLKINPTLRTGQYAPVEELVVLGLGENLEDGEYIGQRIITRETIDDFGKLYTMKEVQAIADAIGASGWRIPTIDDWNDLLNTIECPEDKNHSYKSGWHGRIAGKVLKSDHFWKSGNGNDDLFYSVLPVGLFPNRPDTYDSNSLFVTAAFWSQSKSAAGDYYAKMFENEHNDVKETTFNGDARLSLRLVKDGLDASGNRLPNYYDALYDVNSVEIILGQTVPVVVMPSDRNSGYTLWTKINVSFMNGVRPSEWDDISGITSETAYYIAEWDGKVWNKRQMRDGETVVIADYEGEYKEWKLLDGELQDYEGHIEDIVEELISGETARAISAETALQEQINEESERAISAETELRNDLDEEIERAISADTELRNDLDEEVERAISADTVLQEEIDNEVERAISAETELWEAIEGQGGEISGLSSYTEFFVGQVNDLAENVLGVDGNVDSGFSVDFYDAIWQEVTEEEAEQHRPITPVSELPNPSGWTGNTYIVVGDGSEDPHYYKNVTSNHYISDASNIVEAIKNIDSKVYNEIEELKAEDEILEEEIDAEVERATSAETILRNDLNNEISARTEADKELSDSDIASEDYVFGIDGLVLHRKGGDEHEPITIAFNGNFGADMPKPRT